MSIDSTLAKQILNSRILISAPGKYRVKVTNVTPYVRENGQSTDIVSVNAMTPYAQAQAIAALKEKDYDAACNTNMSGSVLDRQYCPSKGEFVYMNVDAIPNKDGVEILVVQSFTEIPVSTTTKANFDAYFDEVPVEETAEEKAAEKKGAGKVETVVH